MVKLGSHNIRRSNEVSICRHLHKIFLLEEKIWAYPPSSLVCTEAKIETPKQIFDFNEGKVKVPCNCLINAVYPGYDKDEDCTGVKMKTPSDLVLNSILTFEWRRDVWGNTGHKDKLDIMLQLLPWIGAVCREAKLLCFWKRDLTDICRVLSWRPYDFQDYEFMKALNLEPLKQKYEFT